MDRPLRKSAKQFASTSLLVASAAASKKKARKSVAIDAPPQSSSDDEGEEEPMVVHSVAQGARVNKASYASNASSTGRLSRDRGGMSRTDFRPSRPLVQSGRQTTDDSRSGGSLTRDTNRIPGSSRTDSQRPMDLRQRHVTKRFSVAEDDDDLSSSSRASKRSRPANQPTASQPSSQGSQAGSATSGHQPPARVYSRQLSVGSRSSSLAKDSKNFRNLKGRSKQHSSNDDDSSEAEMPAKFIKPPKLEPETVSPVKNKFRVRKHTDEDDISMPKARFKWPPAHGLTPSPKKRENKKKNEEDGNVPIGSTVSSLQGRQQWKKQKQRKQESDDGGDKEKQAVFRMPAVCSTDDSVAYGGRDDGDVSNVAPEILDDSASDGTLEYEAIVCPICEAPIDAEALRTLLPGRAGLQGLKFDDKMDFCAAHRQWSSRRTWASRGYPDIDWDQLDGRLGAHYEHVEGVLEGTLPSHFRGVLEQARADKGEKGDRRARGRHGRPSCETGVPPVPGYYGQRGLRVMSEAIVRQFSGVLRRRAVQDPLIVARGYLPFVQEVLVPELAVRLIMEDMGVEGTEARRILDESVAMGELLHEEVDVVTDDDDEG